MRHFRFAPLLLLALGLSLAACQAKPGAPTAHTIDPRLRSQALIDSGNAAFTAKDYAGAAKRYASAVAVDPEDPAAHYGLGMALAKLGREDDARREYAKARELARAASESARVDTAH